MIDQLSVRRLPGTIFLEDFRAFPDTLVFDLLRKSHFPLLRNIENEMREYHGESAENLKETLDKIDNTMIKPIFESAIAEIDLYLTLERSLMPFYLELIR